MTFSANDDPKQLQNQLAEAYAQLSPSDRHLVQMLSLIYNSISRTLLLSSLQAAKVLDANQKPFSSKTLSQQIDALLEQGILTQAQNQGPRCNPLLTEIVTRDAVKMGTFEKLAQVVQSRLPIRKSWNKESYLFDTNNQLIREVRINFYRHDFATLERVMADYRKHYVGEKLLLNQILLEICNNPFDLDWFLTLSPQVSQPVLTQLLLQSVLHLDSNPDLLAFLEKVCSEANQYSSDFDLAYFRSLWIEQLLLRGCVGEAEQELEKISEEWAHLTSPLWGWILFLKGDYSGSIAHYSQGLKLLQKITRKRNIYFDGLGGLFFILALLKQGTQASFTEAKTYSNLMSQKKHLLSEIYFKFKNFASVQLGDLTAKDLIRNGYIDCLEDGNSMGTLLQSLCLYWIDPQQGKKRLPKLLEPLYRKAIETDNIWLGMETAEFLSRLLSNSTYDTQAEILREGSFIRPLVDLMRPQEAWELCLQALSNLQKEPPVPSRESSEQRLIWLIKFYSHGVYNLQPKEQKISAKSGNWSKGRPVALKRLYEEGANLDYLTNQDRLVCRHIKPQYSSGYYRSESYEFEEKAIVALVGHPLVFWEDSPTIRVEIVKGEPELIVKKAKAGELSLQFSPQPHEERDLCIVKETPTRLKVIEILPEHRRIAAILGKKNQLSVPLSARERVLAAVSAVANVVTIHSDIGGGTIDAEEVAPDPKPHIHLLPAGEGLKVAVLARPFHDGGPYFRPGTGGETVIAEIDGKQFQTTRSMEQEQHLAQAAIAACPTLTHYSETDGEWRIEEPESCLELLLELQNLGEQVIVEWPEGEKFRIQHRADFGNFEMNLRGQQDWFAVEGELQLDDNQVLDMQQLMALLDQSPSRFVPLGNGQFLALTQAFRQRLDELRAYGEKYGKGLRFHPLATLAIEETLDEVGKLKTDKKWKDHLQRLRQMETLQPQVPSTLQAELRDYQIEGFKWMARLAHWGVGACLADDMGLGKTLQALAVILTRADQGPTLIVAPTSVCANWIAEAQRFAPTLQPIELGNKDRQQVLDQLQPFDMLVCSYGLLQQEDVAEMLAQVLWQTIVLDEAQAIKNMTTKRSKAAMNLQGGFKLITTGTPIENHLGELWNQFRFINPGLLGSLERFNVNFAVPIEKYQDKHARQKLKRLIQPFLLRRTKTQVLSELPSRTEITLHVDLSAEEMAFYEALRREAIAKLSNSDANAGQKHLQVLAEIMRLRRACCNPKLVLPEAAPASSKLQLFGEVLSELLENKHKALVFSQFVDHLQILRGHLDEQKIHYQYLDGSTPAKDRQERVKAFQAGQGDVFLISLKAGGTGLNLTAADYVIHMDPWWNPAVEDQASDRAHRIGQQRPVTIYRLVAKGTIEEKIVALHHHKRDLADSLLEGADISGKISTQELLSLISES